MIRAIFHPRSQIIYAVIVLVVLVFYFLPTSSPGSPPAQIITDREIVVAALKHDDVSWIHKYLPQWNPKIYIVDAADYSDKTALTVPVNKGREANVYLTYIIDNYYSLPDFMVFIHSLRYQWHNEDPMYDGVPVLKNLQIPYLSQVGYVPLRCTWNLGCPSELKPLNPSATRQDDRSHTEEAYAESFKQLFPNMTVPEIVGAACGGQFAVTRKKVYERPLSDYEHYRKWLMDTKLKDNISGRIFEYSWHIMFGKPAQNCPPAKDCFCKVFGLCDLECKTEGGCEKRYKLPQYATIPKGWPDVGPGEHGWPAKGWAN